MPWEGGRGSAEGGLGGWSYSGSTWPAIRSADRGWVFPVDIEHDWR